MSSASDALQGSFKCDLATTGWNPLINVETTNGSRVKDGVAWLAASIRMAHAFAKQSSW
jgi:hypothetical protein